MSGCCDDFVPGGRSGGGGGGGGGITNAIQSISGGTTFATGPGVSFANGGGVSFGVNGNTITASVALDAGIGLAAGTQTMATGTAVFANANGISFGLNASTVTASVAAIKALSAGTTNATGTGVSFADGGGVSFGVNGNTITASVASQTPETPFAISAGTQSVSTGTAIFSNANNVSFGMAGSTAITASASVAAIKTISAGTTNATGQGVSFANGSGVSFGINGNTITASVAAAAGVATFSQFTPFVGKILASYTPNQGSYWIAPYQMPNVAFSQLNALMFFSAATNSTGSVQFSYLLGVYTKNVSTLSMIHSTSFASTIPYSGLASTASFNGYRVLTAPWTSSISAGDYWIGIGISTTISSDGGTIRLVCQDMAPIAGGAVFSGLMSGVSTVGQMALGLGAWSVGTGAVPNSIGLTDLRVTNMDRLTPAFALGITV